MAKSDVRLAIEVVFGFFGGVVIFFIEVVQRSATIYKENYVRFFSLSVKQIGECSVRV